MNKTSKEIEREIDAWNPEMYSGAKAVKLDIAIWRNRCKYGSIDKEEWQNLKRLWKMKVPEAKKQLYYEATAPGENTTELLKKYY